MATLAVELVKKIAKKSVAEAYACSRAEACLVLDVAPGLGGNTREQPWASGISGLVGARSERCRSGLG